MNDDKLRCLFKSWGHSREEDAGGVTVYRPSGYDFPRARGRDGLEVHPDGTFVRIDPGPDDRGRKTPGSWRRDGDTLHVSVGDYAARRMTVVHCDDNLLKVRWE